MISEESVELVRRLLGARREHEAGFAFYDTDIEWDATNLGPGSISGLADLQGVYHGHEGVRAYWRRWLDSRQRVVRSQWPFDRALSG